MTKDFKTSETETWIKELSSALKNKYDSLLILAREKMFDIFTIVPYEGIPHLYYGQDVLGNNIAIVWFDDKEKLVHVESAKCAFIKRMN
jgi:hypothetical protein